MMLLRDEILSKYSSCHLLFLTPRCFYSGDQGKEMQGEGSGGREW